MAADINVARPGGLIIFRLRAQLLVELQGSPAEDTGRAALLVSHQNALTN